MFCKCFILHVTTVLWWWECWTNTSIKKWVKKIQSRVMLEVRRRVLIPKMTCRLWKRVIGDFQRAAGWWSSSGELSARGGLLKLEVRPVAHGPAQQAVGRCVRQDLTQANRRTIHSNGGFTDTCTQTQIISTCAARRCVPWRHVTSSINSQSSDLHKSSTAGNAGGLSAPHARKQCALGNNRFWCW